MSHAKRIPSAPEHAALLSDFDAGKRVALARAISVVENQREGFLELLGVLHARLGRAHRIGITGPPGSGKSTLTAALVRYFRARGETVAVIAVDPTSPFTGGALLGDRIRMNDVGMDEGVFIRSMATRGSLGGIALATKEIADVMDAFGFDRIIMETVGVGQSELDIARAADTTLVVLVPESGDGIQAMKAGLMEAADLFAINKSDRPGADRLAREIAMMLHMRMGDFVRGASGHHGVDMKRAAQRIAGTTARNRSKSEAEGGRGAEAEPEAGAEQHAADPAPAGGRGPGRGRRPDVVDLPWEIPVLQTIADRDGGISDLADALDRHRTWLTDSGELINRRRNRLAERVRDQVARTLQRVAWQEKGGASELESSLDALVNGGETPYDVAARIVRAALGGGSAPDGNAPPAAG